MNDPTETERRKLVEEINANPLIREGLEAEHGQVWDTDELTQDFEPLGFMAPFIIVRQKATGKKGSLEFQHDPRFYYNFQEE